ncbi:hypothetical protein [Actinomyces howellii]|uniref:Uncharacterized protein n=1 Tax=Actinomyces howellii TaxID=52771 RepID=A0A3S4UZA7_9ACTO|nr:hypothetical protein [Actinomyces howellii]VEG29994.1 Uncharacterised protein [Actinomyces howellii]
MPDPVDTLLAQQHDRTAVVRDLGAQQDNLTAAIDAYRTAWRAATSAGWTKRDLTRAGMIDPSRLPRAARRQADNATEE